MHGPIDPDQHLWCQADARRVLIVLLAIRADEAHAPEPDCGTALAGGTRHSLLHIMTITELPGHGR